MALEKTSTIDKIEIVGEYNILQIREVVKVTENGNLISQSFHRKSINPSDDSTNEPQKIRDIVNVVHTQAVKDAYQEYIDSLAAKHNGE
jgi:hypothetical protein